MGDFLNQAVELAKTHVPFLASYVSFIGFRMFLEHKSIQNVEKLTKLASECTDEAVAAKLKSRAAKFKANTYVFKAIYFFIVAVYNFQLIKGFSWFPECLGGAGERGLFAREPQPELDIFYQIELAFHLHTLTHAIIMGAKIEMHLHHLVTISLIVGSAWCDFKRIGVIIMLLHDAPDVFSAGVKALLAFELETLSYACFAVLVVVWAYFRLYIFYEVLALLFTDQDLSVSDKRIFGGLLSCLYALHWFWYLQFFQILFRSFRNGEIKDTTEKDNAYVKTKSTEGTPKLQKKKDN
eukprot:m.44555 g.44555  ORF g.44555 m.44555 type:complete len:295 (-) comp10839_c0_seq2:3420-4304(-)